MEDIRGCLGRVRYREHAVVRMLKWGIGQAQVEEAILSEDAEVIEEYPDHLYGACCLVLGWWGTRRPLHIVISRSDPPWVITLWDPSEDPRDRWEPDFRKRKTVEGDQS